MEQGGGAWCPRPMIYNEGKEYLEVNLGGPHIVSKLEVQGRFGNGQGKEFVKQYKLKFWRPGMKSWVTHQDGYGNEVSHSDYLKKRYQGEFLWYSF